MARVRGGTLGLLVSCLALAMLPSAAATDCVSIATMDFSDTLRVIAYGGEEIALGLASDTPGSGFGAVALVAPSACRAPNVGAPEAPTIHTSAPPLPDAPSFPALP